MRAVRGAAIALAAAILAGCQAAPAPTIPAEAFEVFYPGAGHTVDNTVVWIPEHRVLFGGCLVKEQRAVTLGNTAEADVDAWPVSLEAVARRYPTADVVVPGHGAWGDLGLVDHTSSLFG